MRIKSYLEKFPNAKTNSDEVVTKFRECKVGKKLSLEHCKSLSISHLGKIPVNFGKTKENYAPLMAASEKIKCHPKSFKKGHVPHNKGKSKENYEPCKRTSEKTKGRFLGGPNCKTSEVLEKRSRSIKKRWEVRRGLPNNGYSKEGLINLSNTMSKTMTGRKPWNYNKFGICLNPNQSKFMKEYWKNSENVELMTKNRIKGQNKSFNKPERKLDIILQKNFPGEWKYNRGEIIIERRIPDYVNINGKKAIIEHAGCYFHNCPICYPGGNGRNKDDFPKKQEIYSKYGYKSLEIWEHELKDEELVVAKIRRAFYE